MDCKNMVSEKEGTGDIIYRGKRYMYIKYTAL